MTINERLLRCLAVTSTIVEPIFSPGEAVRPRTHTVTFVSPLTPLSTPVSTAQADVCPSSPSPGSLPGQPRSGSGMLQLEDKPGSARLTFPSRLPLSLPPRSGGRRRVGPYRRAGSASPAPPWQRSAAGARLAPLRSPWPRREPPAPRRQPPPTPAPPAAAPALRAVIFIYIRRRRLSGFLK